MAMIRAHITSVRNGAAPDHSSAEVLSPDPRPALTFTDDGPGTLSLLGPRHDNDHDDFRKIEILPTPNEIIAVGRPIYMPKKDLIRTHFLDNGPARHLDTLFRQMRCDSTELIRDICYSAAQIAFLKTSTAPDEQVRQETSAGNRYFMYRNIKIEELLSHEYNSMVVRVSYDCPPFMRGQKLYDSGRFKEGMLVALLELDHTTMELAVYYMEVNLAQSTFSMDSFEGRGTRAAVQLSFLPTSTQQDVLQLCRHALGLKMHTELCLVEFPKVLFAGFYNCLKCLQDMKDSDFAFAQYVAPNVDHEEALLVRELNSAAGSPSQFACQPPAYARTSEFKYDLSKIVPPTCTIASASVEQLSQPQTLDMLKSETTLDEGQAIAFRDSLSRDFACTQGPPGCGKTFLGVKLAQALVDSRPSKKPILLVCLTNHALDNFLTELRDAGMHDLLRIGSGSKEEWTEAINLRSVRRKTRFTKEESQAFHIHTSQKKETIADLEALCKAVSCQAHTGTVPWHYVKDILHNNYRDVHDQFTTKAKFALAQSFTFEYWSGGGDLKTIRDLHIELASRLAQVSTNHEKPPEVDVDKLLSELSWDAELGSLSAGLSSIWNMTLLERQALIQSWEKQVDKETFAKKMTSLYFKSREQENEIRKLQNERDARVMLAQSLIAMTTTACARMWGILRSLDLEILLCEEAAEVMEAHTLCALLPSLEHAVFIGDPQQLRPEANQQILSLESGIGRQYRLDESLLERLMLPQDMSASTIPTSHLSIQRRMHPEIANVTRLTYPYLKDHHSTRSREPTHGVAKRMFWWDHRVAELESDDLKSHANLHEVAMVASLVDYLLRGGAYSAGEIAVLTPYAGQLLKLYERLAATCDIWLSDKDRSELIEEEVLALGEEGRASKDEVAISDMLRIATVDNFQGEEAKVIILSTVRSGGNAGFLKTLNRINVACSRARNGFYVIGDSQTLSQVPMWRQILQLFNGRIGASITTQCHVHPEHQHVVLHPEDFSKVPECSTICNQALSCGHRCLQSCHPPQLHARLVCQQECMKAFDCGHKCPKRCYQTCGECGYSVDYVTLPCGHPGHRLCAGGTSKCTFVIATRPLGCGHTADIHCGEDPNARIVCQEPCGAWLPCQHTCKGKCGHCNGKKKPNHPVCSETCNLPKSCLHNCKATCHAGTICPTGCLEPCVDRCDHGPCKNRCQDACDPCVKQTVSGCEHQLSDTLCCLPSLSLPCCRKCPKVLACGHACPSLDGEICPPSTLCPQCVTGEGGPTVLYSAKCQHLVEISQLDAVNMCGVYQVDTDGTILSLNSNIWLQDVKAPECLCGAPLTDTRRYRIQSKLVNFNNTLDLLIAKLGRKLAGLSTAVGVQEKQLSETFESFVENIRPNPLAAKANTALILRRTREILDLQKRVVEIRELVVDAIQRSLAHLHGALPNIVPAYALMFHLHLDVLEYRVVSVRLADTLKLGQQLLTLQDPSFGVQRQGLKMIEFVHKESIAFVGFCKKALSNLLVTTCPPIEAEIRLQLLQFLLFARSTRVRLADLGSPTEDANLAMDDAAVKASLTAVVELGRLSPGNCAAFVQTARDFANFLASADETSMLAPIPAIRNTFVRQTEKVWAEHKLGHLTICNKGHVYSSKTFFESCPDCEQHAKLSGDEMFRESGKHLFENQFLEAMYARSPKPRSIESPTFKSLNVDEPSEDQAISNGGVPGSSQNTTSAEERFLSMMHKGLPKIQGGRAPSEGKKNQDMATEEDGAISGAEGDLGAGDGKELLGADEAEADRTTPMKQLTMEEKFLVAMRRVKHAMPGRDVSGS